jgi:AraC family transcriptional regulator
MTSRSNHARLAPLLLRIQARLSSPIDLASMARQIDASPYHFHRIFHQSTGETPRQYVERLRLERALLRLALTNESILDICHAVGFQNHETFSRSFRRRYRFKPIEVRHFAQWQRGKQIRLACAQTRSGCELSQVRFESLRPGFLLAKRRIGAYAGFEPTPFLEQDDLWNPLVRWATQRGLSHAKTAWGLTYDIPDLTPPQAQRFDACIPIDGAVTGSGNVQCLRFAGGDYAVLDHAGDAATIKAAFAALADAINIDSDRYSWREGPFLTIYGTADHGSHASRSTTTVCLPVVRIQPSKKRQGRASRLR